jgi:hypothetical protein
MGTIYYIRSENAYNLARTQGFWEIVRGRIAGQNPYLLSFRQSFGDLGVAGARYIGVRSIATKEIAGSLGREREFSRSFLPVGSRSMQKERWRQSYTRLLSGDIHPPVRVCRAGETYFVVNGHHRVSVARYFNVKTIQAHVSEIDIKDGSMLGGDSA